MWQPKTEPWIGEFIAAFDRRYVKAFAGIPEAPPTHAIGLRGVAEELGMDFNSPAFKKRIEDMIELGGESPFTFAPTREAKDNLLIRMPGILHEQQIGLVTKRPATEPSQLKMSEERKGRCYELAWRFLTREDEGELVHGQVWSPELGRMINHAWVETETGYVYEPVADTFYKKEQFYKASRAQSTKRYDPTQARVMALRHSNFGPWDEPSQLREAPKMGEQEKWEAIMRSIRKAARLAGEELTEQEIPEYGNWSVARDMYQRLWAKVKAKNKGVSQMTNDGWVYAKVGSTEMRGRKGPSGIDFEQVSPSYDRYDLDKAVKIIEEKLKEHWGASTLKEPVKPGRVEEIERYLLSDGGFARITRLGHKYTFTRGFPSLEEPPEVTMDLTLDQARKLLADTLRSDVLESEGSSMLHHSPISEHCRRVLAEPPPCYDFRKIRSFVLCKAWDIMEKEKRTKLPVKEAWREARGVCKMD